MNPRILHHKVVMVPCASIISENYCNQPLRKIQWCCMPQLSSEAEVFIALLFLLCTPHYIAVQIKTCSKSTSIIKVATMKNSMVLRTPVVVWNWSIHCPSLSAMLDSLHNSTNLQMISPYAKESIMCNH